MPDRRVGKRQKACSLACQKLRKRENNRAFRLRNRGYWYGRYEYVKDWRRKHPDYQKRWRQGKRGKSASEIQAQRVRKAMECTGKIYVYLREIQAEMLVQPLEILRQNDPSRGLFS